MQKIRIITRNSSLALWQANFVKDELIHHYPSLQVEVIGVTTQGDKILDKSLDKIGGKGLFIKELETGLLEGRADIAVHSLKDLPAKMPDQFTLAAILKREDARDAFVSSAYDNLSQMPHGSVIGTSSARRIAVLKRHYPQLHIKLLRGNLTTRLNKLDNGEYDAIILAVAGLKRLGLKSRIKQHLSLSEFIPAIGQGALAIEVLANKDELVSFLAPLEDRTTRQAITLERLVGEKLQADCSSPVAVHAIVNQDDISLDGMFCDGDYTNYRYAHIKGTTKDVDKMVKSCVNKLLHKDES